MALAAASQANFFNNTYSLRFSDPVTSFTVSNVYLLELRNDPLNGFNYGFRLSGPQVFAPTGGDVSDYRDVLTSAATSSLIIAETNELPGDVPGQKHVLLGMSDDAAGYAAGMPWSTLFGATQEETIISALEHYEDNDPAVTQQALQDLVDFAYGPAVGGILDNQAQPHTAWFTPGGSFSLMTWSDGALVGTGTSTQIETTPEPASMAALGLGALLLTRKRRR